LNRFFFVVGNSICVGTFHALPSFVSFCFKVLFDVIKMKVYFENGAFEIKYFTFTILVNSTLIWEEVRS